MTQTPCVSESVAAVAAMVKSGNLREAKRTTAQLLDNVHPQVLAVLGECADILSRPNAIARPKLTALWQRSDTTARKIIEACAPARDEWDTRTVPETPVDERPRPLRSIPGEVTTRKGQRISRQELRNRRNQRRDQRHTDKDAAAYFAHRAGVDDQPRHGDRPDAYALDYDRAALCGLRGLDCVACWIERTRADHTPNTGYGDLSDDGLCSECRERGRVGVPSLPAGFTLADAVAARCTYIATRHHPATARTLLRGDWHTVNFHARTLIADWVKANAALVEAPAETSQAPDVSCACGSHRQVRNGQCLDCRQLDTDDSASCAPTDLPTPVLTAA